MARMFLLHRIPALFSVILPLASCLIFPIQNGGSTAEEAQNGDFVYVEVSQGTIIGQEKSFNNYTYHSFESIPYAMPPVGLLRFKDPQPSGPWEEPLNATIPPTSCPQPLIHGGEDCLYLNIFTPPDSIGRETPLPVMVFFYGGAFIAGGSRLYSGAQPLVHHDVIYVTTNYRVGILGFLSTEDEAAPGNLGLKDQTLALRWVNENIEAFGGDTSRITIFGQSAGAASVHYQMLTPESEGLFSGAIMQSGSAFIPIQGRNFYSNAKTIGERFNCSTESSEEMIACLQTKNYLLIDEMYSEFIVFNGQPFIFGPRVDGEYIPDEPARLVKEGRYHHVPSMMGINRDEGSMWSGEMYWDRHVIEELAQNFTKNGPASLQLYPDEDPVNTAIAAYEYYLDDLDFDYDDIDNATKLYGDRDFNMPLDWLAIFSSDMDTVYKWELRHRGEHSILDILIGINKTIEERWISHGDELLYLMHPLASITPSTHEDMLISDLYTKMWTNFAKTRNPTPDDSLGFVWEKTNPQDLRALIITAELPLQMETDTRVTERTFWESLPLRINDILQH